MTYAALAADRRLASPTVAVDAELRRELHLVAAAGDRPADQHLVVPGAVDVGGVEERDAELERAVDRGDRLVPVAVAVALAHPHAAEPEAPRRSVRPASQVSWP